MTADFLRTFKWRIGLFVLALGVVLVGIVLFKKGWHLPNRILSGQDQPSVSLPTIVNGELILPKIATDSTKSFGSLGNQARIGVVSANLIAVVGQDQKISGIRVLGEMVSLGERVATEISPVIRFLDSDGKTLGQKIGHPTAGWVFFGLGKEEKTLYDVTVDNPPQADKLEIVLNVASASDSALFDEMKIASRSMEVKTATYQGNNQQLTTNNQQGTESGNTQEKVEYYSVTGSVINILSDPVSDITIYSWARDKEGKVFAFNRQDFRNDLLMPNDKLGFRITLLPLKDKEVFDSYEVAAWGKRYRLNL